MGFDGRDVGWSVGRLVGWPDGLVMGCAVTPPDGAWTRRRSSRRATTEDDSRITTAGNDANVGIMSDAVRGCGTDGASVADGGTGRF